MFTTPCGRVVSECTCSFDKVRRKRRLIYFSLRLEECIITEPHHSFPSQPVPGCCSLSSSIRLPPLLLMRGRGSDITVRSLSAHWSSSPKAGRYCHKPTAIDPPLSDHQRCFSPFLFSLCLFTCKHLSDLDPLTVLVLQDQWLLIGLWMKPVIDCESLIRHI